MKNLVILGFLGAKLDSTTHEDRWNFWRPTVALGMHEELLIKRFELFYQPNEGRPMALHPRKTPEANSNPCIPKLNFDNAIALHSKIEWKA